MLAFNKCCHIELKGRVERGLEWELYLYLNHLVKSDHLTHSIPKNC